MDPNQEQQQTTTAADLVNHMSEMSLVQLFQNYGDVSIKESKRVARLICQKRPLHTTLELVQAILGEKNKGKHFLMVLVWGLLLKSKIFIVPHIYLCS